MASKQIHAIIVPLDGSKNSLRGLDMAILIAKQFNATITVVHCINIPQHLEFQRAEIMEEENKESESIIDYAKKKIAENGIDCKSKVIRGDTGYNITKLANSKKQRFDMIVMSSRGRGAIKEIFLGSVSNYVIHASKIPVLLVK